MTGMGNAQGWREERRRDSLAAAEAAREDEAARARTRIVETEASARMRREERQVRHTERQKARKQRAARWAGLTAWLRAHVADLLFVPVIAVPGALAWSAMAAYGHDVFGPIGFALPAFSEGAMWVFEARATWAARQDPPRPVWHLSLGSWVFAAVGATLNFLGGLTVIPGHPHGLVVGAVKAIVSAAGLVAHQMVNLGPRRSRAARRAAKFRRAAERREQAVRNAALGRSVAVVDAAGNARLVVSTGRFTLSRRYGRARLEAVAAPRAWLPWPAVRPGTAEPGTARLPDAQAAEAVTAYRDWRSARMDGVPAVATAGEIGAPSIPAGEPRESVTSAPERRAIAAPPERRERRATNAPSTPSPARQMTRQTARQKVPQTPSAKRAKAVELLTADPSMSRADVVQQSGVSERTADRIRAELPRQLHVVEG